MDLGSTPEQRLIWNWRQIIPSFFTLAAMLAGFLSILVTIQGMVAQAQKDSDESVPPPSVTQTSNSTAEGLPPPSELADEHKPAKLYRWAALLIMLAMILDGLDGNVARWLHGESDFGAELDTYVDMTAFGIAPAILVFAVTLHTKDPVWRVLLPSAVALSGVVRLARFKVKDPLRGQGGYGGLPITVNAAWVALFIFITLVPPRDQLIGGLAYLFLAGVVIFIFLQVTNLRYPKPTKKAILFVPCIILVALLWLLRGRLAARVAMFMILLGLGYVIIGPLFVKGMAAHRARKEARNNEKDEEDHVSGSPVEPTD